MQKIGFSFAAFLLLLVLIFTIKNWKSEGGTYKFLMPNTVSVNLSKGNYNLWYFWYWPSKGINSSSEVPEICLTDATGKIFPAEEMNDTGGLNGINKGRPKYFIVCSRPQTLEIACKKRCVLVIVPHSAAFYDIGGGLRFSGSENDNNFYATQKN